jgi:MFS family permease
LDHYDTALYGFLAPFIAPVFFPKEDPIVALIYTYGLMLASLLSRPLGAMFFGKWGAQLGGKHSFILSLSGLSVTTGLMGLVPGYNSIGIYAPIAVALLRLGQGFFAAGETTIAPLFILHHVQKKNYGKVSGLFGSTTVFGELIASLIATVISITPHPELLWRLPFLASFATGLVGLYMRSSVRFCNSKESTVQQFSIPKTLFNHKRLLARIIVLSGLTYITYSIPFVFLNSFIPKVTSISLTSMLMFNTTLLIFDMMLAPLLGLIADRFTHKRFMAFMTTSLMVTAIPLFALIPNSSLLTITLIRTWIVILGLGINVPFKPWLMDQVNGPQSYLLAGIGYSIGSELFGRNAPTICFWLWHQTGWVYAPALYIVAICFLGFMALTVRSRVPRPVLTPVIT